MAAGGHVWRDGCRDGRRLLPTPDVFHASEEARYAVIEIGKPWRDTPGALDWLARTRQKAKARTSRLPLERLPVSIDQGSG
jgi:hypothetical protein